MKDVRAVAVDQHALVVVVVVSVARDVVALVDDEDFFTELGCQTLSQDAAGKTGTYNQIVKHVSPLKWSNL